MSQLSFLAAFSETGGLLIIATAGELARAIKSTYKSLAVNISKLRKATGFERLPNTKPDTRFSCRLIPVLTFLLHSLSTLPQLVSLFGKDYCRTVTADHLKPVGCFRVLERFCRSIQCLANCASAFLARPRLFGCIEIKAKEQKKEGA
jgi:hypothetical protein